MSVNPSNSEGFATRRSHAPRGNAVLDAPRPDGFLAAKWTRTTQSVEDGIPTQSVGTRSSPLLTSGYGEIARRDLLTWIKIAEAAEWAYFGALRHTFGLADQVGNCVSFDAGNNRFRPIGRVFYCSAPGLPRICRHRVCPVRHRVCPFLRMAVVSGSVGPWRVSKNDESAADRFFPLQSRWIVVYLMHTDSIVP
ncbi:MAG: type II toxin-antitoxin system HigB family toxin [Isosphaeraceae bacterium]